MKNLYREKQEGKIFGPFSHEQVFEKVGFFRTNPMGSVTNNDGSFRMINDLSFPVGVENIPSVNSLVDKIDFQTSWDKFESVSRFFKEKIDTPIKLAIFDWKKAYRQGPTHPSQWRYLMIKDFEGDIWVDTRIAFGGVAGCGTFGWMADLWREIIEKTLKVEKTFRWVDDIMFVKEEGSNLEMESVKTISRMMGVISNDVKFCDFDDEQKYLGFIWNGKLKTISLPDEKLKQRILQVVDFIKVGEKFTLKQAEKLVGQLNHLTYILPNLKCHLSGLYHWINAWFKPSALRSLPRDALEDLLIWEKTLKKFNPLRVIPDVEVTDLGWFGDASTGYGIGVLQKGCWSQLKVVEGWESKDVDPSKKNRGIHWLETVAVRVGLLMAHSYGSVKGKKFVIRTDNTTTEAAISHRKSREFHVNSEWKIIQSLLTELHCDLSSIRVTSAENIADSLSRGDIGSLSEAFEIRFPIPTDLIGLLEFPIRC